MIGPTLSSSDSKVFENVIVSCLARNAVNVTSGKDNHTSCPVSLVYPIDYISDLVYSRFFEQTESLKAAALFRSDLVFRKQALRFLTEGPGLS